MKGLSESILKIAICIVLLIFVLFPVHRIFSQDSVKTITISKNQDTSKIKARKDSLSKPMNFFVLKSRYQYMNQMQPDTITRNRILWYPLKSIEEVFDFLPGYYLKYMDVGQRQNLEYDRLGESYTGVFRFGRPINDLLDGSFDLNSLSRNEIDEIEVTDGLGSFPYDYSNGINVIQRQLARSKPYSEISYWQDRYNNLYLDANFHQNLFRKLNFNFGVTKHSYDGEYTNSDFDKWLGRFNFNFAFSNKVNAFFYANYSRIQRGLNGGINPDTVDINNTSQILDVSAIVRNPNAFEIRERFDLDLGLMALTGKDSSSFAKLQFFESDAFRKYADEENRPILNGILLYDNSHWINYGVKVQNLYNFKLSKQTFLQSNSEGEFDLDLIHSNLGLLRRSARIFLFQNLGLRYRNINLDGYVKAFAYEYYNSKFQFNYGLNSRYNIVFDSLKSISLNASYQNSVKLPTYFEYFTNSLLSHSALQELKAGIEAKNSIGKIDLSLYYNKTNQYEYTFTDPVNIIKQTGFTGSGFVRLFKFDIEGSYQQELSESATELSIYPDLLLEPKYSGNASVSWHDMAFKNHLEYKIGLTSRAWSEYYADFYDGFSNTFTSHLPNGEVILIPANATLDFYIIAKINKATFGLTLENILNRVIYTTGVYPYMDRGGLANVISRFNITWYFLN